MPANRNSGVVHVELGYGGVRMRLLCIDPGPVKSGWVFLANGIPDDFGWHDNETMQQSIRMWEYDQLLIEDVSHMGMAVGRDVFETVRWSGRFDPNCTAKFIDRKKIKLALCGNPRAKDPHIRQAIIDRYGGDSVAIGAKKCPACKGKGWRGRGRPECTECAGSGWEAPPGVLHGISGHSWSALAVGLTYLDMEALK